MKRTSLKLTHEADAGLRKLRSDANRLYYWSKSKYEQKKSQKEPEWEIAKKVIAYHHPKTGQFQGEEFAGWIIIKKGKPLKKIYSTKEKAKQTIKKLGGKI